MTPSFADVESQARLLTAEERARLAEIVLETLQETPSPKFRARGTGK